MTSAHGEGWATGTGGDAAEPRVVIRDRRRIDPDSGEVRSKAAVDDSATGANSLPPVESPVESEHAASLREQLAERTGDLQRLKAEFDNYRRRVERDRQVSAEQATGRLLASLLPALDDIARARDHGDLEGPFKTVAESLEVTLENAGLERFGSAGEPFDPMVHDALMHSYRSDVGEATCVEVFRSGYRHAGRVLRPAQVTVAEPPPAAAEPETDAGGARAAGGGETVEGETVEGGLTEVLDIADTPESPSEQQRREPAESYEPNRPDSATLPDDTGSVPSRSRGDEAVSAD